MTTTTDRPTDANLLAFTRAGGPRSPDQRPEPAANSLATPAQRTALAAEIEARISRDFQRLRNLGAHDAVDRVLAIETRLANEEAETRALARIAPEAIAMRTMALAGQLTGSRAETETV